MKGYVLALLGLVTACDSSGTMAGGADATSDAPPVFDAGMVDGGDDGPDPCADAGVPPATLACTGLYADFATKRLAPNAVPYTPSTPLWSDNAQKARWIELPLNATIDISNPDEWTFPVGTKLFKEFRIDGQRVETRMFQKTAASFWVYATYAWNGDDSATINYGGPVAVGDGGTWNIPSNDDCNDCHKGRQDRILGFEQVSLGLPGAQGLTLAQLAAEGLVTPAPASVSLTIGDDGTGIDPIALGWIHVNCGVTCHNANPSAAGYGAGMLLRLDPTQLDGRPPNAATWDVLKTTLDVPCVSGSVAGQPRIVPGDPESSVLYQLIDERGTLQMPPIASVLVDVPDVAVVHAWIQAMASGDGGMTDLDGGDGGGHHDSDGGMSDGGMSDGGTSDGGTSDGKAASGDADDDAGD